MSVDAQTAEASAVRRRRARLSIGTRSSLLGVALITPAIITFAVIIAGPLIQGVTLGFYWVQQITLKTRFEGFGNFARIFRDGDFQHALWITIQYTIGGLVLQIVLGVIVALVLNQSFYGRGAARSLMIFPYLVPVIVATTVWRWLLNDTYGIVNSVMIDLGLIKAPIAWFADPDLALISVILVSTWRVFPFVVIAVLGRMQNIPRQLYDAARTDGASSWSQFWDVTLPQLRSVLIITIFLRFIWDFNDFGTVALLTGGGPVDRTLTLPMLIYNLGFAQHQLGPAAAVADLTLIVLTVFFIGYFWIAKPLGEKS